jgi:hypothetical protein
MGYHLLSLFNASAILLISFKHCFLSNIVFFQTLQQVLLESHSSEMFNIWLQRFTLGIFLSGIFSSRTLLFSETSPSLGLFFRSVSPKKYRLSLRFEASTASHCP